MARIYVDYKNKMIWKRIHNEWLWYQCIWLFKDYMKNVLWIAVGKSWSAKEVWANKYKVFDKTWKRIVGTWDLLQWDVIVTIKWDYWHIGIFDRKSQGKIFVLEQNWQGNNPKTKKNESWDGLWANAIRVQWYDPSFRSWVRRSPKIIANYQIELAFINAKLKTMAGDASATLDYKNSIRWAKS